jgi:hypothetical protein
MQTGKVLGIGAALSAGLLAAHVASASTSLTLEEYSGNSSFKTATLSGSAGSYTASNGSYSGVSWTSVAATVVNSGGTASLELSFTGLTGSGSASFLVSDTAFSETGTGLTLSASESQTLTSGTGTGNTLDVAGFADSNNAAFGVPSTDSFLFPNNSVISESSGAYAEGVGSPPVSGITLSSNYSLTANALVTLASVSTYNATFKTSVTGAAPAAVSLPGSGPLTIIGGLVMVGGLAIRRRIKV